MEQEQSCPKCKGRMWDNRLSKRNPKAPDYKCREKSCDGVIWPPRDAAPQAAGAQAGQATSGDAVVCPKCGGQTWDNRLSKRNPKAPDYRCRQSTCDGVIWPPRDAAAAVPARVAPAPQAAPEEPDDEYPF